MCLGFPNFKGLQWRRPHNLRENAELQVFL